MSKFDSNYKFNNDFLKRSKNIIFNNNKLTNQAKIA